MGWTEIATEQLAHLISGAIETRCAPDSASRIDRIPSGMLARGVHVPDGTCRPERQHQQQSECGNVPACVARQIPKRVVAKR